MPARPRRRLRQRRYDLRPFVWAAGVLAGLLVVVGALATYRLVSVARDLHRARSMIQSASADIEQGRLQSARSTLVQAQSILLRANDDLYGKPELEVMGWLPVVSDNLDSLQSSVGLGLRMVSGGERLLELTQPLENAQGKLEVTLDHGTIPLSTVVAAERQAADLAAELPDPRAVPSSHLLLGPVRDLQDVVYREAGRRRAELDSVSRALALLADMAGANGPRRYLIDVANPAEMRGSGGMMLSYGVLESKDGTISLGDFGGIDDLALTDPLSPGALATLGLPQDYLDRWSGLQPTYLWRNTTLAPDFGFDAKVMEGMFTAKTGLPVDGVIQIDPEGLAAILQGTGPVDVPGVGTVTADNVVDLTINRAYIDFPNRDQRQEVLSDVAKAAFKALVNGSFSSLRPFGQALFQAAGGRHLVFVPDSATARHAAAFFGADGALPSPDARDYSILTVQNFSKNKLDYYVDTGLALTGARPGGRPGDVTATVTVTNTVPPNVPSSYIMGPNDPDQRAGLYRARVSLYVPNGTTLVGSTGADAAPALGSEAGRTVISYDIALGPGSTSTVALHLAMVPRSARAPYSFALTPIPRVRPTIVSVDLDLGDGERVTRNAAPLEAPATLSSGQQGSRG